MRAELFAQVLALSQRVEKSDARVAAGEALVSKLRDFIASS